MSKMILRLKILLIIIITFTYSTADIKTHAANSNYIIWWPARVHENELSEFFRPIGGVQFLNYDRSKSFAKLQNTFTNMISKHKPDILIVLFDWKDIKPIINLSNNNNAHPEGTRTINDVVGTDLSMEYFDDLVLMANQNNLKVILYPNLSAYGGPVAYPFTYYSRTGWFWKRPDWKTQGMCADAQGNFVFSEKGCADPASDAMRHPSLTPEIFQNLTRLQYYLKPQYGYYQYIAHQAGYDAKGELGFNSDGTRNPKKWNDIYTIDGVVDTGVGIWQVTEGPDLVYNGYDTVIIEGNGQHRNVNTPIPSLSSEAYRNLTKATMKKIAQRYKEKGIYAYNLFQEPSYAILRENISYCFLNDITSPSSNFKKNEPPYAGNNCLYEVDYSAAERNRYNYWRQNIANPKLPTISQIPYPLHDMDINKNDGIIDYPAHNDAKNYIQFRKWNLASFLKNLSDGIHEADPNAKIAASLYGPYYPNDDYIKRVAKIDIVNDDFYGVWLNGAVGPKQIIQQIKPDLIFLEPPSGNTTILEPFTHPDTGEIVDLRTQFFNLLSAGFENNVELQKLELVFYYPADADNTFIEKFQRRDAKDTEIKNFFISKGIKNTYFPALNDAEDTGGYAHWMGDNCARCNFRAGYNNPEDYKIAGDLNSTKTLNTQDLIIMSKSILTENSYDRNKDFNLDNKINLLDLIIHVKYVSSAQYL